MGVVVVEEEMDKDLEEDVEEVEEEEVVDQTS